MRLTVRANSTVRTEGRFHRVIGKVEAIILCINDTPVRISDREYCFPFLVMLRPGRIILIKVIISTWNGHLLNKLVDVIIHHKTSRKIAFLKGTTFKLESCPGAKGTAYKLTVLEYAFFNFLDANQQDSIEIGCLVSHMIENFFLKMATFVYLTFETRNWTPIMGDAACFKASFHCGRKSGPSRSIESSPSSFSRYSSMQIIPGVEIRQDIHPLCRVTAIFVICDQCVERSYPRHYLSRLFRFTDKFRTVLQQFDQRLVFSCIVLPNQLAKLLSLVFELFRVQPNLLGIQTGLLSRQDASPYYGTEGNNGTQRDAEWRECLGSVDSVLTAFCKCPSGCEHKGDRGNDKCSYSDSEPPTIVVSGCIRYRPIFLLVFHFSLAINSLRLDVQHFGSASLYRFTCLMRTAVVLPALRSSQDCSSGSLQEGKAA